jgi:hypothetical protein
MDDDLVAWLLGGDVAVQYRTWRDLLGRDDALTRHRVTARPGRPMGREPALSGRTHLPPPRAGRPHRWVTLAALRVLTASPQPR